MSAPAANKMRSLYSVFIAIWIGPVSVSHDVSRVFPHAAIANHTLKRQSKHHPVTIGYHVDASAALFPNVAFDFLVAPVAVNQHSSPRNLHTVVLEFLDCETVLAEVVHQLVVDGSIFVFEVNDFVAAGIHISRRVSGVQPLRRSVFDPALNLLDQLRATQRPHFLSFFALSLHDLFVFYCVIAHEFVVIRLRRLLSLMCFYHSPSCPFSSSYHAITVCDPAGTSV